MLVFIVASEIDALKILLMDVAANNLLDIHATLINVQIKTSVCMQTCKLTACYLKKKHNKCEASPPHDSSSCKTDLQFTGLIKTT